ncbi:hypothetical protein PROVRETT_07866 [Providencia rettgeri DSM 1131]|nr:hypothetical protein PROVRETT_07866 [Providencia rettgeri DSM 1131]
MARLAFRFGAANSVMVILPILSVMAVMKKVSLLAPSMSIKEP